MQKATVTYKETQKGPHETADSGLLHCQFCDFNLKNFPELFRVGEDKFKNSSHEFAVRGKIPPSKTTIHPLAIS